MIVRSDVWHEGLGRWLTVTSEVADPDPDAEARGLADFLASCDEEERAEYFRALGVELGAS